MATSWVGQLAAAITTRLEAADSGAFAKRVIEVPFIMPMLKVLRGRERIVQFTIGQGSTDGMAGNTYMADVYVNVAVLVSVVSDDPGTIKNAASRLRTSWDHILPRLTGWHPRLGFLCQPFLPQSGPPAPQPWTNEAGQTRKTLLWEIVGFQSQMIMNLTDYMARDGLT